MGPTHAYTNGSLQGVEARRDDKHGNAQSGTVTPTLLRPRWVQGVLVLILAFILEGDLDERLL